MKPKAPPADGPITKALIGAIQIRREMLDKGHPEADVDYIVGQGLKAALGNTRPQSWRFYCEHCKDTGWVNVEPSAEECARLMQMYGDTASHQGYVVKCEPCKWTQMEREKRRKQRGQELPDDDLAAAGQTKKPRSFKRLGE